jgi:diacylglycerol kinase family enzyme
MLPQILTKVKASGVDYLIHRTINRGDAETYVCETMKQTAGKGDAAPPALRFYAVGGDGTLNEVVNGVMRGRAAIQQQRDDSGPAIPPAALSDISIPVEVAFVPTGTGNDFPRNFGPAKYFLDIGRQINGRLVTVDLIRYNDRYLINMLNIGLDCAVVAEAGRLKKKPFISGTMAYIAGIVKVLGANRGFRATVEWPDGEEITREFTLIAAANGKYCGGGFKGLPLANCADGLMDINLVEKIKRRTFVAFVRQYHAGKHLDQPKLRRYFDYRQVKSVIIRAGEPLQICADGEIAYESLLNIEICPQVLSFVLPEGC